MNDDDKLKLFQKELLELYLKHGFYVDGCGCCNSPYIRSIASVRESQLDYEGVETVAQYVNKIVDGMDL